MKKLLIIILLTGFSFLAKAQDNLPFTINSAGGYGIVNGQMYDFNLGEMVLTETFSGVPGYLFSQGFLQPLFTSKPLVDYVEIENNVITPNGDGKNDVFVVYGLEKYPGNKFSIYDRAGRLVYSTTNYQNDWNGMFNGRPLNEDTYYYVIDLGKGYGLVRGFISIILDNR